MRPDLGQGHQGGGCGEGHLETRLGDRLGLQQQDAHGGERQGMQADRLPVHEHGPKRHRGGDGGPLGRRRRAGEHQVGDDRAQGEPGGDLLPRDPQRQPRPRGDAEPGDGEHEAADDGHVQAGDRDDVGQARGAQVGDLGLGDEGVVARGHRRGQAAGPHAKRVDDPPRQLPAQRVDPHGHA